MLRSNKTVVFFNLAVCLFTWVYTENHLTCPWSIVYRELIW